MAKIIEVTAENKIDTRLFDSLLKEYRSAYEQKQKLHDLVIKSILSGAKKHHLEFGELEEVDDEGLFQFLLFRSLKTYTMNSVMIKTCPTMVRSISINSMQVGKSVK